MAGTAEGVKKAWLKRKRKGKGKAKPQPRPETQDTLKKGATLMELAAKWGVSPKEIIKLNKFTSPDQIVAGATIRIPAILSKDEKASAAATKQFETNKKSEETARKKEEAAKNPKKKKK